MFDPINERLTSSCSKKGIIAAATETNCFGYLRYDTGKNAECPWFCSPDGQDDTLRPITQAEYEAIQAKYAPIELDMRADLVYSGE